MKIENIKRLEELATKREVMAEAFKYMLSDKECQTLQLDVNVANHSLGTNSKRGGLYINSLFTLYLRESILLNLSKIVEDAINLEMEVFEEIKEDAIKEAIAVIKGDV